MSIPVTCCFCDEELDYFDAWALTIWAPTAPDTPQTVHCHRACLREHLPPRIPLPPEADE